MAKKEIGARLMIEWGEGSGRVKVDERFHDLDALYQLDFLQDWIRGLQRLYSQAHDRMWPTLAKTKEDYEGTVLKAIENMEKFHESNPLDSHGLAKMAVLVMKARDGGGCA